MTPAAKQTVGVAFFRVDTEKKIFCARDFASAGAIGICPPPTPYRPTAPPPHRPIAPPAKKAGEKAKTSRGAYK